MCHALPCPTLPILVSLPYPTPTFLISLACIIQFWFDTIGPPCYPPSLTAGQWGLHNTSCLAGVWITTRMHSGWPGLFSTTLSVPELDLAASMLYITNTCTSFRLKKTRWYCCLCQVNIRWWMETLIWYSWSVCVRILYLTNSDTTFWYKDSHSF